MNRAIPVRQFYKSCRYKPIRFINMILNDEYLNWHKQQSQTSSIFRRMKNTCCRKTVSWSQVWYLSKNKSNWTYVCENQVEYVLYIFFRCVTKNCGEITSSTHFCQEFCRRILLVVAPQLNKSKNMCPFDSHR